MCIIYSHTSFSPYRVRLCIQTDVRHVARKVAEAPCTTFLYSRSQINRRLGRVDYRCAFCRVRSFCVRICTVERSSVFYRRILTADDGYVGYVLVTPYCVVVVPFDVNVCVNVHILQRNVACVVNVHAAFYGKVFKRCVVGHCIVVTDPKSVACAQTVDRTVFNGKAFAHETTI